MSARIAPLAALLLVISESRADPYAEQIHRVRGFVNAHACYVLATESLAAFEGVVSMWIGDTHGQNAPDPLDHELGVVAATSAEFFEKLQPLKNIGAEGLSRTRDVSIQLRELARIEASLPRMSRKIEKTESMLLAKLAAIDTVFLDVETRLDSDREVARNHRCDAVDVLEPLEKAQKEIANWRHVIGRTRLAIGKSREKRRNSVTILVEQVKSRLLGYYAATATTEISELQSQIHKIFAALRLDAEIAEWWAEQNTNGLVGGLDTRYLLFEEPVRRMGAAISSLEDFVRRVREIDGMPEPVRIEMLNRLTERIETIRDRLDPLVSGGWESQFRKQRQIIERRLQSIHLYVSECQSAIEAFNKMAVTVSTYEAYRTSESLYATTVDSCKRRPS